MAFLTSQSSLADQSCLAPIRDFIATPMKTASGNSCKNLIAIQRLVPKLWTFGPVTQIWPARPPRDQTLTKTESKRTTDNRVNI
jgi:hypothetical protein